MVGIYIGIAVLAVAIVAVFVDNLPSNLTDEKVGLKTEVGFYYARFHIHEDVFNSFKQISE